MSLNAVLDDDSDFKLTEAMPDNESHDAAHELRTPGSAHFLMENLRPRERKVLDLRFGLTGNGTHSLRQIGHLLRISKERVRQIQNRALEKLRASAERVGWEPSLLLGREMTRYPKHLAANAMRSGKAAPASRRGSNVCRIQSPLGELADERGSGKIAGA